MKLRPIYLTITCLVLISYFSNGQTVRMDDAKKIAEKAFSQLSKGTFAGIIIEEVAIKDKNKEPAFYLFSESKGGFVIVAADKRVYPLLGWSESGPLSINDEEWPPAFKEMVNTWTGQIQYIRENDLAPAEGISDMWTKLEKGEEFGFSGSKDVLPLLSTKWNQGCGYNSMCPVDAKGPCGRAYTGCVATAMAQVIRYNQYPATGKGSKCYTTGTYGELCADFASGIYDYASMTATSGNSAVARLMYHCGVAVSMSYGPSSSGAYSGQAATALRTYFNYANGLILSKSSYPEESWVKILKGELDNNRPVYYSGYGTSGHAFVLDGHKETNHFHINWGWGGVADGYFYLSSLNPSGRDYTSGQQAIVGMVPADEFAGPDFSKAIILGCRNSVQGNLASGNDMVNYYKNIYPAALGKELVYTFTTTLPGRIRIKITGQSHNVNTFLLNYPDKDSLVTWGTNGLVVDGTRAGTYYVAVESTDFQEPTFIIEAICPTADADLDISSAAVNPGYVQSLQSNVALTSTVKNIGNTISSSCMMEYFLSADVKVDYETDTFLGGTAIESLSPGNGTVIQSVITMPDGLLPGNYYIIFAADRLNLVPEADDENRYAVNVTVPDSGKLDCSLSVALADGAWYYGNTLSDGINRVEKYSGAAEMTGPEVVHTFTSPYNGMVRFSFVDKSPGELFALILPVCNENTGERSIRTASLTDTLITDEFYAVAGTSYFIVVDGNKGASGDYGLMVDLPGKCPVINVKYWGETDLCEGDQFPGFYTFWGHNNYQWFRNGIPVPGAVNSNYTPLAPGSYHVEIAENGCTGASDPVNVRMDTRPDTAYIVSLADTIFCAGGSVTLKLENTVSFPANWAIDGTLIPGETGNECVADETGSWSLYTVNGACRVRSGNTIFVEVHEPPVNIDKILPFPSDRIRFFCPFIPEKRRP